MPAAINPCTSNRSICINTPFLKVLISFDRLGQYCQTAIWENYQHTARYVAQSYALKKLDAGFIYTASLAVANTRWKSIKI
jgi:hypothetical protein